MSRKSIAPAISVAALFACASCGTSVPDAGANGRTPDLAPPRIAVDEPAVPVRIAVAEPEVPLEPGPNRPSDEPAPLPSAEPSSSAPPMRLAMEPDAEFIAAPRPAVNPGRYGAWRQKARINVGKTHLDTAETSADEAYLLVMSAMESTIRIYERATRALVGNFAVEAFSPGTFERGDVVFWPGMERGYAFLVGNTYGLSLYSALDGTFLERLDDRPVWEIQWSPDRRYLLCNLADISTQTSVLTVFRRDSEGRLGEVGTVRLKERLDGWALSADNRYMAATFYPSDTLELVDLHTGEVVWSVAAPTYSGSVDISFDGTRVAIGGNHLVVMDAADPKKRATYSRFGNNIHQVRFSPAGDAVAASAYDGHLRILSADPGAPELKLLKDLKHGGTANVYAATFLADGSGIISSSGDTTVRYWGK